MACGCTSILVIQMFLNVSGVLGLFPLSGKPIPFVSYGGSSIISSLMLAGLVMSVSLRSELPETAHDEPPQPHGRGAEGLRRRRATREPGSRWAPRAASPSSAAVAPRRTRARGRASRPSPSVSPAALRRERAERERAHGARVTTDSSGRRRIDLGPSAGERLRRDSSPNVRGGSARTDRRSDRRGR